MGIPSGSVIVGWIHNHPASGVGQGLPSLGGAIVQDGQIVGWKGDWAMHDWLLGGTLPSMHASGGTQNYNSGFAGITVDPHAVLYIENGGFIREYTNADANTGNVTDGDVIDAPTP